MNIKKLISSIATTAFLGIGFTTVSRTVLINADGPGGF